MPDGERDYRTIPSKYDKFVVTASGIRIEKYNDNTGELISTIEIKVGDGGMLNEVACIDITAYDHGGKLLRHTLSTFDYFDAEKMLIHLRWINAPKETT